MKKIYLIPLIIFYLLLIGAKPLTSSDLPSFFDLDEQTIIKNGSFIDNGAKMNYYSEVDIEIEYQRLLEELKSKYPKKIETSTNKIVCKDSNSDIKILLWKEKDKTAVEMTFINNNSSKTSLSLKNDLERFKNHNSRELKFFSYVRVSIDEENYSKTDDKLMKSIKKDTIKGLDIHNGNVCNATLKDGQNINIGYMKYDSGRQIIIGTPVIFVTY